jgi:predicted nucleotidyltransferase
LVLIEDLPVEQIVGIGEKYGIRNVRLFGSRARGDASHTSDLDLLVEYADGMSLLDVIGFEQELSDILGIVVETVSEVSLHPLIKDRVLAEATPLVAA